MTSAKQYQPDVECGICPIPIGEETQWILWLGLPVTKMTGASSPIFGASRLTG